ncbi:MAG: hypothetical protein K0R38_7628 [Polyangiaceae bacterium]|nr:hypothetical protein [Polyangiaceae bacterium]
MTRALRVLLLASLVSFPSQGRATEAPLQLSMSECTSLSEQALREHLALELSTLGLSTARVRLQLRCSGGVAEAQAARAEEPPATTRVALDDTARGARERLVALAISELVAQIERARPPSREPAPVVARPESAAPRPPRKPANDLSAAASAVTQGTPRSTLWGAALAARVGVGERWSLLLDGRFERGTDELTLADVRWTSLSALVGAAARARAGPLELSAALGVRAGWLSLVADAQAPDEGRQLTAPWAGVAVPLRAAWGSDLVRPFVGAEAGYVVLPVRGRVSDGPTLVEHRGGWLSVSLGVAIAL